MSLVFMGTDEELSLLTAEDVLITPSLQPGQSRRSVKTPSRFHGVDGRAAGDADRQLYPDHHVVPEELPTGSGRCPLTLTTRTVTKPFRMIRGQRRIPMTPGDFGVVSIIISGTKMFISSVGQRCHWHRCSTLRAGQEAGSVLRMCTSCLLTCAAARCTKSTAVRARARG